MKEYIDRELLLKEIKEYRENDPWWAIRRWWDAYRRRRYFTLFGLVVSKFPAADVVEVVRCKVCQHYYNSVCTNTGLAGTNIFMNPFDYCSYGERMDKEE